jgi:YgiT-type zinc finger domain-containing protein
MAGARIDHVTRCYGKGETLLVIKDVPVVRCPHCHESYLAAQTLHEIERIKLHRQSLAVGCPVPIAEFSLARNAPGREGRTSAEWTQIADIPIPTLKGLGIPGGAGCVLARPLFAVRSAAEALKAIITQQIAGPGGRGQAVDYRAPLV